ncbi:GerAB/ArcD/ProY family transporter [Clostridium folliculivorans]|uniref:Germination protein GRKB n=1 Tax=Clostridium folliculivorans TaxID=2886038 RepID=A0A9W5XYG2_9CLOT|nr:endospore germination permease [Clostridium folliculivorans]GKU23257.1 germination protein GRKB [Clostridium folliculivorans]GKU29374.1 germination protein GRKB [Clostridium folliculivorans]
MKIEKGMISSSELMFLIIALLQGSTLTATFISGVTKQDTWVVVVVSFFILCFLLQVYLNLAQCFPEKNIIEINDITYGAYLGKFVSIIYIYHFWFIVAANLRFIADFFSTFLMQETDIIVFIVPISITCIYVIRKGIEVVARMAPFFTIFTIVAAIIIAVMLFSQYDIKNMLPMFQLNSMQFLQGVNVITVIPFGELLIFLMIFPSVGDKENIKKYSFKGMIIGVVFFLMIIVRNTLALGIVGEFEIQSSFQVAKLIDIADIISRLESLIAVVLLFNVFMKIAIFCYGTVLSIAQILKLKTYKHIVSPIVIISIIFSITMYESPVNQSYTAANIYPVYAWIPEIVFPIISLIIAKLRNLK